MKRFFTILFCSIISLFSFASLCFAENLTFTMLDVGQADAFIIQTAGKIVLLDAAEDKELVKNKLLEKGIRNLDVVFATHPHSDHIGGMLSVLQNINVKAYIDNGFPHTSGLYENLMTEAERKVAGGMRYISARKGQRFNIGKEAHFEVLWPDDNGIKNSRSDINANSIIMKLVHGEVCFYLMADAEAETEQAVLNDVDKCQILKVAHHGSPYSSIDAFLDKAQPEVALISAGLANKHGHPGERTLNALQQRNAKIYRTDRNGEVTVVSDGINYTVSIEKNLQKEDLPCIDINNATSEEFQSLSSIGNVTADHIMAVRASHIGPYNSVDELIAELPQDPAKRLRKMKDYLSTDCSYKYNQAPKPADIAQNSPQTNDIFADNPMPSNVININIATVEQLAAMPGMSRSKADAAIIYRNENGAFKSCRDLQKVKGIGEKSVEKLLSVCTTGDASSQIAQAPAQIAQNPQIAQIPNQAFAAATQPSAAANGIVNINTATVEQLAAMPGMNRTKADAAIAYRTQTGPFAACKDMQNVKGIGKKTVEKLLSVCTTGGTPAQIYAPAAAPQPQPFAAPAQPNMVTNGLVNINIATVEQLAAMPGMNRKKADAAIIYRNENGAFKACTDLQKVNGIGKKTVEKLLSVCAVE